MSFDRSRTHMETFRHIVRPQPCRVEPLFQRLGLTRMPEPVPKPNAAK